MGKGRWNQGRSGVGDNMHSEDKIIGIFFMEAVLLASFLVLGMVSLFAVVPILIMTVWINKTVKRYGSYYGHYALVIFGAITAILSSGILVSWGFRAREKFSVVGSYSDVEPELLSTLMIEIFSLGLITVIATTFVLRAAQSKNKLAPKKASKKSFRQKIRDGDIQSKVDRPIRKSVKK